MGAQARPVCLSFNLPDDGVIVGEQLSAQKPVAFVSLRAPPNTTPKISVFDGGWVCVRINGSCGCCCCCCRCARRVRCTTLTPRTRHSHSLARSLAGACVFEFVFCVADLMNSFLSALVPTPHVCNYVIQLGWGGVRRGGIRNRHCAAAAASVAASAARTH